MSTTIIPDEGLILQHQDALQVGIPLRLPWKLILWKNDIEPDSATELADLVECDFGGYGRVTILPTNWTGFNALGGCSHATYGLVPVRWDVTSGPTQSVYGWAMIDDGNGVIRRVQRFESADIAPVVVGVPFLFLPEVTFTSAECQ